MGLLGIFKSKEEKEQEKLFKEMDKDIEEENSIIKISYEDSKNGTIVSLGYGLCLSITNNNPAESWRDFYIVRTKKNNFIFDGRRHPIRYEFEKFIGGHHLYPQEYEEKILIIEDYSSADLIRDKKRINEKGFGPELKELLSVQIDFDKE